MSGGDRVIMVQDGKGLGQREAGGSNTIATAARQDQSPTTTTAPSQPSSSSSPSSSSLMASRRKSVPNLDLGSLSAVNPLPTNHHAHEGGGLGDSTPSSQRTATLHRLNTKPSMNALGVEASADFVRAAAGKFMTPLPSPSFHGMHVPGKTGRGGEEDGRGGGVDSGSGSGFYGAEEWKRSGVGAGDGLGLQEMGWGSERSGGYVSKGGRVEGGGGMLGLNSVRGSDGFDGSGAERGEGGGDQAEREQGGGGGGGWDSKLRHKKTLDFFSTSFEPIFPPPPLSESISTTTTTSASTLASPTSPSSDAWSPKSEKRSPTPSAGPSSRRSHGDTRSSSPPRATLPAIITSPSRSIPPLQSQPTSQSSNVLSPDLSAMVSSPLSYTPMSSLPSGAPAYYPSSPNQDPDRSSSSSSSISSSSSLHAHSSPGRKHPPLTTPTSPLSQLPSAFPNPQSRLPFSMRDPPNAHQQPLSSTPPKSDASNSLHANFLRARTSATMLRAHAHPQTQAPHEPTSPLSAGTGTQNTPTRDAHDPVRGGGEGVSTDVRNPIRQDTAASLPISPPSRYPTLSVLPSPGPGSNEHHHHQHDRLDVPSKPQFHPVQAGGHATATHRRTDSPEPIRSDSPEPLSAAARLAPPSTSTSTSGRPPTFSETLFSPNEVVYTDARDAVSEGSPGTVVGGWEVVRELGRGAFSKVVAARLASGSTTGGEAGEGRGDVFWARGNGTERGGAVGLGDGGAVKGGAGGGGGGGKDDGKGELMAIKMIDRTTCDSNERMKISVMREVEVLKHIHHPSLVHLISAFSTPFHTCLVLEYSPGGELFEFLADHHMDMSEALARRMFCELVDALAWTHGIGLVHRDIKLENILLTCRPFPSLEDPLRSRPPPPPDSLPPLAIPLVKLTDFGLSRFIDHSSPMLETRCGSEEYAAPELIMGRKYDGRQTDAWALGVVLYAIITGMMPFVEEGRNVRRPGGAATGPDGGAESHFSPSSARSRRTYLLKIAKADYAWPTPPPPPAPTSQEGLTDPKAAENYALLDSTRLISPEVKHLVGRLLVRDPNRRAKVVDIWDEVWANRDPAAAAATAVAGVPGNGKSMPSWLIGPGMLERRTKEGEAWVKRGSGEVDRVVRMEVPPDGED